MQFVPNQSAVGIITKWNTYTSHPDRAENNRGNASRFEDGKLPKLPRMKCHADIIGASRATALIWIMSARRRPSPTLRSLPQAPKYLCRPCAREG